MAAHSIFAHPRNISLFVRIVITVLFVDNYRNSPINTQAAVPITFVVSPPLYQFYAPQATPLAVFTGSDDLQSATITHVNPFQFFFFFFFFFLFF